MIEITGWLRYDCGDVYLTFEDPTVDEFDNSLIVACGDEYTEGDKRSYLKEISVIHQSFWDFLTEDELERLIDNEDDVSFKILMLSSEIRTLIKSNSLTQDSELEIDEDDYGDEDETDNNEKKIISKQKTEVFVSSLSSLI